METSKVNDPEEENFERQDTSTNTDSESTKPVYSDDNRSRVPAPYNWDATDEEYLL